MAVLLGRRKVSKGDILLTARPFVYQVNATQKGLFCDHCLKRKQGSFQRCSGCSSEWYCNKDCQRGSWDVHKYECKNLKRLSPKQPPDAAKLIAKVIIRLKTGGDQVEDKVTEKRTRRFKDLMNHYKDVKDDKKRQEHLTSLRVVLEGYMGKDNLPNEADLQGIYGRICINSFTLTDSDMNSVGTGVYIAASVFDHSCQPNAFVTFDGTRLICRSLVDWPDLDISKIRISYIDVMNTNADRLNELHKRYYFWCDCNACHDEERGKLMSTINCGNTSCNAPVFIDEEADKNAPVGPCLECGFSDFSTDTRAKYCEAAQYSREKLDFMKEKYYLDTSRRVLEDQGSLFHKLNLLRVKTLDSGFEAAIDMGIWDSAIEFGTENLDGMKFYYGEHHPTYGMMLLKLGKICSYMGKLKEALTFVEKAKKILQVSHGVVHPTYKDELLPLLNQLVQEIQLLPHQRTRSKERLCYGEVS